MRHFHLWHKLLDASTSKEALEKARAIAGTDIDLDDKLTVDGKPAKRSFVGIRKLITIQNPVELDPNKVPPMSGTEITYSLFEISNEEDLAKLAAGESVTLNYVE